MIGIKVKEFEHWNTYYSTTFYNEVEFDKTPLQVYVKVEPYSWFDYECEKIYIFDEVPNIWYFKKSYGGNGIRIIDKKLSINELEDYGIKILSKEEIEEELKNGNWETS